MPGIVAFWKRPGETLAVMLRRFREEHGLSDDEKLTYAGRLDPMAEGVVLVLHGDARFQKERYQNKDKTYEVEVLLGIATDSADMLGIVTKQQIPAPFADKEPQAALDAVKCLTVLPYPMYSSRPVNGVPLFVHARKGADVSIPDRKVAIREIEMLGVSTVSLATVIDEAMERIGLVEGDFRQEEILKQWKELSSDAPVQVVTIRTTVSSGTYMRTLAEKIGEFLGTPALAYTIKRTGIDY